MIDAGLPLVQCLEILGNNQENQYFKKAIIGIRSSIEGGSTLANSMRAHPKIFDDLTTNMIEAGETGGILDTILQRIAQYVEKAVKMRAQIKSALVYPVSVIVVAVLIVGALLKFVVPIFANLFVGLGVALPASTQFVVDLSAFVSSFWWLIFLTIGLIVVAIRYMRTTPKGRFYTDKVLLNLPVFGPVLRKIAVARFTRTLGTLISAGVPILEAIMITRDTSGNYVYEKALTRVHDSIREGESIAEPLAQSGVFDDIVINMIDVGEETGELDKMLLKIADNYDAEVDAAVGALMSILEPLLIVGLGFTVGFIVVALFLPLVSLLQGIGSKQ